MHFVHASDEWYILAGREFPEEERYDGYLQLENGVGMMRLPQEETMEALSQVQDPVNDSCRTVSVATGRLAAPYISELGRRITEKFPHMKVNVYPIRNDFFGESITVAGLLTGKDLINQLKDKEMGERLLLPCTLLRSGEQVFLDDVTVEELENTLQIKVRIVKSSGYDLVQAVLGTDKHCDMEQSK